MKSLFEKKTIFSLYLMFLIFCSFGQETDTIFKNGIKYLYIIENDNLFRVTPKNSELCSSYFITDSINLKKFDHLNAKEQYYFLLNSDCYKISICWREIEDIIPNIDSTLANIIIKEFPLKTICRSDIFTDSKSNYKYYYSKVNHKKFVVFLISVDFYNYLLTGWRPLCQIYSIESEKDKMYIRLLVPLFDEDKKFE
jgi:hypothetical protein